MRGSGKRRVRRVVQPAVALHEPSTDRQSSARRRPANRPTNATPTSTSKPSTRQEVGLPRRMDLELSGAGGFIDEDFPHRRERPELMLVRCVIGQLLPHLVTCGYRRHPRGEGLDRTDHAVEADGMEKVESVPQAAPRTPSGWTTCCVIVRRNAVHRELVRRKWTYRRRSVGGRPPIPDEVRELIPQMGRENPRWGCLRMRGELAKLGIRVSATKIRTLLRANGLGPAPRRDGPTWSEFIRSQAHGILALDFLMWRRSCFGRCTCCSRSMSVPDACTSSVSPRTQTRRG